MSEKMPANRQAPVIRQFVGYTVFLMLSAKCTKTAIQSVRDSSSSFHSDDATRGRVRRARGVGKRAERD